MSFHTKRAKILTVAAGKPKAIAADMVKEGIERNVNFPAVSGNFLALSLSIADFGLQDYDFTGDERAALASGNVSG